MKLMQLCVGMVRTNCYIVYDEATCEAAVIDPGDNAKSILHAVNEEQLNVRYVLLTHAHFDHILAAHEVLEATGAQYVVPEKDTWLLSRDNMVSSADWHATMCRIRRIFWRTRAPR